MATTKRQRQKAARQEKLEAQQRQNKIRKTRNRVIIIVVVAAVVLGTGFALFSKSSPSTVTIPTSPPTTAPASTTAETCPATSLPASAPKFTMPATAAPTKMVVKNLKVGTGATLKVGQSFTGEDELGTYSCKKLIQSSWPSPFSATLSTGNLIPGWVQGLPGMKVGGRRELIIPPALGYGSSTQNLASGIAANDTLVFIVDLVSVTK